jgi:hypothetical protein
MISDYAGMLGGSKIACDGTRLNAKEMVDERRAIVVQWHAGKYDLDNLELVSQHESMPKKKKKEDANADDDDAAGTVRLYDCMDKYVEDEPMEGFNWECKRCKNVIEPLKTYCM